MTLTLPLTYRGMGNEWTARARKALQLIKIPTSSSTAGRDITNVTDNDRVESLPAISFLDHLEIYPGSKIAHFKQFHKITGIPYSEMVRVGAASHVGESRVVQVR
jgi:hypothetical protein